MMKISFDTLNINQESINEYIKEVQNEVDLKLKLDVVVTINNVNGFQTILNELEEYKENPKEFNLNHDGVFTCYDKSTDSFYYKSTKEKQDEFKKIHEKSLINVLYLPKKVLDADISNFDLASESRKKVYKYFNDFVIDFKNGKNVKGLYLYGTFAIGKTYALACLANLCAKNGIESLLIYFPDLVTELKSSIGTNRYVELINKLKSIDVLMLDDLGSENLTPFIRDEVLGPILNYREAEGLPLFVSSNISVQDLKEHLSIDMKSNENKLKAERIQSRMNGLMKTVNMQDSTPYKR